MLTIDINNPQKQCNLACEFCYSWDLEGILSLEDIKKVVEYNPQHTLIELGGGEPMLHKEIVAIVSYLTLDAHKNVHIATNGTYVPKQLYELPDIARQSIQIQVSLHASTSALFGVITGNFSLFDKVLQHLTELKTTFSTIVNTALYQKNYDDLPNIVELVHQYDVPHRINLVMPVGRGKEVALLTAQQIAEVTSYLLNKKSDGYTVDSPLLRPNTCPVLQKT